MLRCPPAGRLTEAGSAWSANTCRFRSRLRASAASSSAAHGPEISMCSSRAGAAASCVYAPRVPRDFAATSRRFRSGALRRCARHALIPAALSSAVPLTPDQATVRIHCSTHDLHACRGVRPSTRPLTYYPGHGLSVSVAGCRLWPSRENALSWPWGRIVPLTARRDTLTFYRSIPSRRIARTIVFPTSAPAATAAASSG